MADRVMIFIDGSNVYHSLKNHFGRTDRVITINAKFLQDCWKPGGGAR